MKIFFASATVALFISGCSTTAKQEPLVTYKSEVTYERSDDKTVTADVVFHEYQDGEFVNTVQAPRITVLEGETADYTISTFTVPAGQQSFSDKRSIKYVMDTQPNDDGSLKISTLFTNTEVLEGGLEIIHQHEETQTIWHEGTQTVKSPL